MMFQSCARSCLFQQKSVRKWRKYLFLRIRFRMLQNKKKLQQQSWLVTEGRACIFPLIFYVLNSCNTQSFYFHIQTSSHAQMSHTFNIEIYLYSSKSLQADCSEFSTAWNIPCNSEGRVVLLSVTYKLGFCCFFLIKTQGPTLFF